MSCNILFHSAQLINVTLQLLSLISYLQYNPPSFSIFPWSFRKSYMSNVIFSFLTLSDTCLTTYPCRQTLTASPCNEYIDGGKSQLGKLRFNVRHLIYVNSCISWLVMHDATVVLFFIFFTLSLNV